MKFYLFTLYFANIVAGTDVPVRPGTFVPASINDAKRGRRDRWRVQERGEEYTDRKISKYLLNFRF